MEDTPRKIPILIYEDMYIVDKRVQKHQGETIWKRKRVQGGRTLSTDYLIYKLNERGVSIPTFIKISS